jgi:hypothetical protein
MKWTQCATLCDREYSKYQVWDAVVASTMSAPFKESITSKIYYKIFIQLQSLNDDIWNLKESVDVSAFWYWLQYN